MSNEVGIYRENDFEGLGEVSGSILSETYMYHVITLLWDSMGE